MRVPDEIAWMSGITGARSFGHGDARGLLATCAHTRLMLVDFLHTACETFQVCPSANRPKSVR